MKPLLIILIIFSFIPLISHANTDLPTCEGNIEDLKKFSIKHYKKVRNWSWA